MAMLCKWTMEIMVQRWREQRRFALKHLKDFGFGKSSMEDIIHIELIELGEHLRSVKDEEVETEQLFNFYVMNTLWSMMSGSRWAFQLTTTVVTNTKHFLTGTTLKTNHN